MKLVIVESPTKAKTLTRFLGKGYQVEASMGHLRDLPKSKLGVDVDDNFKPEYVVVKGRQKVISQLRKAAKKSQQVILATDLDREGEAIAYHISYLLGPKVKFSRIVFHEITKQAIEHALKNPGDIDQKLVASQQARRILDRLVGYKLSPILWRKVRRGLSAGRVQSVALRLIVEREKEITAFKPEEYWNVSVKLKKAEQTLLARLTKIDSKKALVNNQQESDQAVKDLNQGTYQVVRVVEKQQKRYSWPPFITSSLQRAAGVRFGWSAKRTMRTAQQLYEKGLISYHRTDSTNLAGEAVAATRKYIVDNYGNEYLPDKPVFYKNRSKMVQAAHEAIRPTMVKRETVAVDKSANRLYLLIWERLMMSQMKPALIDKTVVEIETRPDKKYSFRAEGEKIKFLGWAKVNLKMLKINDEILPDLQAEDSLDLVKVIVEQKFTLPPARYSEASLIKMLEEKGIGRPSTYASILSTIQARHYVEKEERKLVPTPVGMTVVEFLVKYFTQVMDYEFTAGMENDLDEIARGKKELSKILANFYGPFVKKVDRVIAKAKRVKIAVESTGKKCPECTSTGSAQVGEVVIRVGRFGKFLSCSRFPECKYTATYKQVVPEIKCPDCGAEVVIKKSRRGKQFYGCGKYPKCKWASWSLPKNKSKNK